MQSRKGLSGTPMVLGIAFTIGIVCTLSELGVKGYNYFTAPLQERHERYITKIQNANTATRFNAALEDFVFSDTVRDYFPDWRPSEFYDESRIYRPTDRLAVDLMSGEFRWGEDSDWLSYARFRQWRDRPPEWMIEELELSMDAKRLQLTRVMER